MCWQQQVLSPPQQATVQHQGDCKCSSGVLGMVCGMAHTSAFPSLLYWQARYSGNRHGCCGKFCTVLALVGGRCHDLLDLGPAADRGAP